jgi:hypothetical protein
MHIKENVHIMSWSTAQHFYSKLLCVAPVYILSYYSLMWLVYKIFFDCCPSYCLFQPSYVNYILSDYSYCCYSATWLLSEFSNMYQLSMTNSDSAADYWVTALSSVSWLIFLFLTPQWHFWQTLCTSVIGCATKEGLLSLVDKLLGEFYVNVISLFLNYVLHRNKMPTE